MKPTPDEGLRWERPPTPLPPPKSRAVRRGRLVNALLLELEARGRLDAVALAPVMDVKFHPGTYVVSEIVRCVELRLVTGSVVGGRLHDGGSSAADESRRGDVDLVVGFLGEGRGDLLIVTDPLDVGPTPNGDGTFRVCEADPIKPAPHHMRRLEKLVASRVEDHRPGLILGGDELDRGDAVANVDRSHPDPDRDTAARDALRLREEGCHSDPSRKSTQARARARSDDAVKKERGRGATAISRGEIRHDGEMCSHDVDIGKWSSPEPNPIDAGFVDVEEVHAARLILIARVHLEQRVAELESDGSPRSLALAEQLRVEPHLRPAVRRSARRHGVPRTTLQNALEVELTQIVRRSLGTVGA